MRRAPDRATMRRFWPNEPDLSGHVRRAGDRWTLVSDTPERRSGSVCDLGAGPLHEGNLLRITECGGEPLPFRVAKCAPCRQARKTSGSAGRHG